MLVCRTWCITCTGAFRLLTCTIILRPSNNKDAPQVVSIVNVYIFYEQTILSCVVRLSDLSILWQLKAKSILSKSGMQTKLLY